MKKNIIILFFINIIFLQSFNEYRYMPKDYDLIIEAKSYNFEFDDPEINEIFLLAKIIYKKLSSLKYNIFYQLFLNQAEYRDSLDYEKKMDKLIQDRKIYEIRIRKNGYHDFRFINYKYVDLVRILNIKAFGSYEFIKCSDLVTINSIILSELRKNFHCEFILTKKKYKLDYKISKCSDEKILKENIPYITFSCNSSYDSLKENEKLKIIYDLKIERFPIEKTKTVVWGLIYIFKKERLPISFHID